MIHIDRGDCPRDSRLWRHGPEATDALASAHQQGLPLELQEDIYKSVRDTLLGRQHGKCCFCESAIRPVSYGDVEHFRPKLAVQEDSTHPGYWWLVYDWSNLLVSCRVCNTSHKRAQFPLLEGSPRARLREDNIADEQPVLIDPAKEEPGRHLTFREEIILGKTERGRRSIELLGLDRSDDNRGLEETRREVFQHMFVLLQNMERLLNALELPDLSMLHRQHFELWEDAITQLSGLLFEPTQRYQAMLRANFERSYEVHLSRSLTYSEATP